MSTPSPSVLGVVVCRVPRRPLDVAERARLAAVLPALPDTFAGRLAASLVAARLAAPAPPPRRYARPVYGPGPVPAAPPLYAVRVAPAAASTTLRGEAAR